MSDRAPTCHCATPLKVSGLEELLLEPRELDELE